MARKNKETKAGPVSMQDLMTFVDKEARKICH